VHLHDTGDKCIVLCVRMKLGFRRAQSVGRDCARGNGRCFPCFNFMPIVPCAYINNTKNKKKIIFDVCTSVKRIVADRLFTAKPSERKSSRRDKTRVSHYYVVIYFFHYLLFSLRFQNVPMFLCRFR